jgi:hypothetical protein
MARLDCQKFIDLYMDGLTDSKIAKEFGLSDPTVWKYRTELEWPSNQGLFSWQKKLDPLELSKIPEKYRTVKTGV